MDVRFYSVRDYWNWSIEGCGLEPKMEVVGEWGVNN